MPEREPKPKSEPPAPQPKVQNQWELLHHLSVLLGRTGVIAAGIVVALYFGLRLYSSELGEAQKRLRETMTDVADVADRQVASVKAMLEAQEAAATAEREANRKRLEAESAAKEAESRKAEAVQSLDAIRSDLETARRELAATTESKRTIEQQRDASTKQLHADAELLALAVLGVDDTGKAKDIAATYARPTAEKVRAQIDGFIAAPQESVGKLTRLVGAELALLEDALLQSKRFSAIARAELAVGEIVLVAARAADDHGLLDVLEFTFRNERVAFATAWQHLDAVAVPLQEDVSRRRAYFVKLPYAGPGLALDWFSSGDAKEWTLATMLESLLATDKVRELQSQAMPARNVLDALSFLAAHQAEFAEGFADNTFDFAAGVRLAERARSWSFREMPSELTGDLRASLDRTLTEAVALAATPSPTRSGPALRELGALGAAALASDFRIAQVRSPTVAGDAAAQKAPVRSAGKFEIEIEWSQARSERRQRLTLLFLDEAKAPFAGIAEFRRASSR